MSKLGDRCGHGRDRSLGRHSGPLHASGRPPFPTATTFTLEAVGSGRVAGFVFSVNGLGARATTAVPAGWIACADKWVTRKGESCRAMRGHRSPDTHCVRYPSGTCTPVGLIQRYPDPMRFSVFVHLNDSTSGPTGSTSSRSRPSSPTTRST
jgi:hypothetical protein